MFADHRKVAAGLTLAILGAVASASARQAQLVDAVKENNASTIESLLQQGADPNAAQGDGATALHWAAYRDDRQLVDRLISAGANVNAANDLHITPVALASANGNATIVRSLLQAGADPNVSGETGVTPLMEAARVGSAEAVATLLEFAADVNAHTNDRQQTALMWAAAQRHPEVVGVLLENDADVSARTMTRGEVVMLDLGRRRVTRTAAEDATEIERGAITALFFAAQSGDVESARLLLDAGGNVNDAGADDNSVLVMATLSGQGPVARLLLERGADPNAADGGYSALHAAVLRRDPDTAAALLDHGADVNAPLTKGSPIRRYTSHWALSSAWAGATPLMLAAHYLETGLMRLLLDRGAALAPLPDGTTPLLVAAGTYVERRVNRPLDHSDTPRVLGDIFFARSEEASRDAVAILLDAGADVNQAKPNGETAMHAAAAIGFASVVQLLADRGADVNVETADGRTPLALAASGRGRLGATESDRARSAELLRQLGATE